MLAQDGAQVRSLLRPESSRRYRVIDCCSHHLAKRPVLIVAPDPPQYSFNNTTTGLLGQPANQRSDQVHRHRRILLMHRKAHRYRAAGAIRRFY
jgi:hypothetical protein